MSGRALFWIVSAGLISSFLWIIFTVGTSPVTDQERRARQAPSAEEVRQAYLTRRDRRNARRDEEEEEEDATPMVVYEQAAPAMGYAPAPQQVERRTAYNDDAWRASQQRPQEPVNDPRFRAQQDPYMTPRREGQYEDDYAQVPQSPPQPPTRYIGYDGRNMNGAIDIGNGYVKDRNTGEVRPTIDMGNGIRKEVRRPIDIYNDMGKAYESD